jgi:hypothetical protein
MLLARGVTKTIKDGIIKADCFKSNPAVLMYGFMCALFAAAVWLYVATYLEMPVSTTHSIIGCVSLASCPSAFLSALKDTCSALIDDFWFAWVHVCFKLISSCDRDQTNACLPELPLWCCLGLCTMLKRSSTAPITLEKLTARMLVSTLPLLVQASTGRCGCANCSL